MSRRILSGRDELVVTIERLEKVAKEMQDQSQRQWKISICVSVTTLVVAVAAITVATLNYIAALP